MCRVMETGFGVIQAAGGVSSFCKTILVLRALLQHHRLAPVLEMLLKHINFEEFVLAGMLLHQTCRVVRCVCCTT